MKTKRLNREGLIKLLKSEINTFGTQKRFAETRKVSPTIISEVLLGRREPSKQLLDALNLKRVVSYEEVK